MEVSAVSRSLFAASPMSKKTAQSTPKKAGKVAASYKIIQRATGSLGGNADGGAIYGELTEGSMQRIVETLKTHCQFGAEHSFIDVGSGLGKPNVHAAQDPGAIMSYGLELEELRWQLGMVNLKALLAAEEEDGAVNGSVFFRHGDIHEANSFDPFTHVYMYDLGFPPETRQHISDMWARSGQRTRFLVSYIKPKVLIETYDMDIEEMVDGDGKPLRVATHMHGSAEGHTAYFYQRRGADPKAPFEDIPGDAAAAAKVADPLFREGFELVGGAREDLIAHVDGKVVDFLTEGRRTRSSRRRSERA